ncbi:hypothetical protein TKK_0006979 [Trichogramma kaykai]|uniref:mRNA-decapping enzyme C-terminal domain-containing protein n=1 Tax=Trichogramma kaykai TaxID=54128 RepID=A0ABD2XB71_9HYME
MTSVNSSACAPASSGSSESDFRMNIAALKRVDPYVKTIIETATHVALYTFNGESNEWEKTEIEGAMFVYSRIGEPYNSIIIMNRLNTQNQVEPVTPGLDLQLQEPFLLYKNSKGLIYGIWFYDRNECVKISSVLNKLAKESDSSNKVIAKNKKPVQKKTNNVDIFSMLSKAQEDYNSNKSGSSDKVSRKADPKSPMSNAIGELSGALNAMAMAPDVTSKSVMDFFAKAKVNPPVAQLMSHPAAHTVENIEKQHRSNTPQPSAGVSSMSLNSTSCEESIIAKLQKKANIAASNKPTQPLTLTEYAAAKTPNVADKSGRSDENHTSSFLRIQSPNAINSNAMQNRNSVSLNNYGEGYDSVYLKQNTSLPSQMYDTAYHHNSTYPHDDLVNAPLTPKSSTLTSSGTAPALIPPGMFAASSSPATTESLLRPVEPLTRNQLLQGFNYLLRNDPEFVNKLHEAYVKSFSEILS